MPATPDIQFLFRFRDLVASTLAAHRLVIASHGWCWWGWWKRPSEDGRSDIWDEIERLTSGGHPIEVGLFDSGRGEVFLATVTGVIKPVDNGNGIPEVQDDQKEHIPQYYRDSPFSRAWIKMTTIDITPIGFFENYSFAELKWTRILGPVD